MATMLRVNLPDDDGVVTVSTSVVAFSTCGSTELAIVVGSSVAKERLGVEFRAFLRRWADTYRPADGAVGGTNRKVWMTAPTQAGEAVAPSTVAQATAPTETQWGVCVGDAAATSLDKSNWVEAAVERCVAAMVSQFGL